MVKSYTQLSTKSPVAPSKHVIFLLFTPDKAELTLGWTPKSLSISNHARTWGTTGAKKAEAVAKRVAKRASFIL